MSLSSSVNGEETILLVSRGDGAPPVVCYTNDAERGLPGGSVHSPSPLAEARDGDVNLGQDYRDRYGGGATVPQTTTNIAKACMGTGTLALPFATSQGGYLFSTIGMVAMGFWNLYCVDRLIRCAHLLPDMDRVSVTSTDTGIDTNSTIGGDVSSISEPKGTLSWASFFMDRIRGRFANDRGGNDREISAHEDSEDRIPPGTSKFGLVAWHACGPGGLHVFDTIMVTLLFGIVIAYEDASLSFIARTPITTHSPPVDAVLINLLLIPMTCVPDVGFLNKFSAMGIASIVLVFTVIFFQGFVSLDDATLVSNFKSITSSGLWPADATGVANWFGVIAFSFGMVPITYNLQDSMADPSRMIEATKFALWIVLTVYVVIGNGVAILFSPASHSFEGDVLEHLPNSWISTVTRLLMTFVMIVSAPLLVVPCSEIVEGKMAVDDRCSYWWKVLVRVCICMLAACISIMVPGFVLVISIVGSCCVALVSFALPPLFYILLVLKRRKDAQSPKVVANFSFNTGRLSTGESVYPILNSEKSLHFDIIMLAAGILSAALSSYLTFMNMLKKMT